MRKLGLVFGAALAIGSVGPAAAQGSEAELGRLYAVDLASGRMTLAGTIGDGSPVVGLAFEGGDSNLLVALTEDRRLLRFSPAVPAVVVSETELTGLPATGELLGIDVRPATGDLLAIGRSSTLYTIDAESGAAAAIGPAFSPVAEGDRVGFDFNPTVDRIRLVTDAGQNLRLNPETGQIGTNPDTGEPTVDGEVAYAPTDPNAGATPELAGAGYTNSIAGAESTVLYVIDTAQGVLAVQDPPNDGVLNTVGDLGVEVAGPIGFDIAPSGAAYAAR